MSTYAEVKEIVEKMRNPQHNEEIIRLYENWAQSYDQDVASYCEYEGLADVTNILMAFLGDEHEARIIDLGAGTGLVGEILSDARYDKNRIKDPPGYQIISQFIIKLYKHGYHNLDALDPSRDMLDQAEKKGIYTRLICDYLGPNKLDIPDASYNAAAMCGTFVPNHANDSCFEEIVRILKPGAVFVFNINENNLDMAEFKEFTARVKHLAERGIWKVITCDRRKYTKVMDQEWDMGLVYSVQKQE